MTVFQLLVLPLCAMQVLTALLRFVRSRHWGSLAYGLVWMAALVVAAWPALSTRLAHTVGIGRGVDLVIYGLLASFTWAHYQQYLRYKRVESHVSQLVRQLAIHEAWRPASGGPRS